MIPLVGTATYANIHLLQFMLKHAYYNHRNRVTTITQLLATPPSLTVIMFQFVFGNHVHIHTHTCIDLISKPYGISYYMYTILHRHPHVTIKII